MSKLVKPGIDLYEQQMVWLRIFESLCRVEAQKDAPCTNKELEKRAWAIYEGLKP